MSSDLVLLSCASFFLKSKILACFETRIPKRIGSPCLFTRTNFTSLSSFAGRGSDRYMKGSKVMLTRWHSGQTRVDLYCPWNKSTMSELFLFRWFVQDSIATHLSSFPLDSLTSTYGFGSGTLLRSSWSASRRKARNSWESCIWYPENWVANFSALSRKDKNQEGTYYLKFSWSHLD